jgi:hypothetical protein
MRNNAGSTLIQLLLLILIQPMVAHAAAEEPRGMGLATASGDRFQERVDWVLDRLKNMNQSIIAESNASSQPVRNETISEKFETLCHKSQSYQNRVQWDELADSITLTFACFDMKDSTNGETFFVAYNKTHPDELKIEESSIHLDYDEQLGPSAYIEQGLGAIFFSGVAYETSDKVFFRGEHDKRLHAAGSALMASFFGSVLADHYKMSTERAAIWGAIASCTVGGVKELLDPYLTYGGHRHQRDIRDFEADLVGCTVGAIGFYVVNKTLLHRP